jgi:hypothetical protein
VFQKVASGFELLEPGSFELAWTGLAVDVTKKTFWSDVFSEIVEFSAVLCFEKAAGTGSAWRLQSRLVESDGHSGRVFDASEHEEATSRTLCKGLSSAFHGDPRYECQTLPAVLTELEQRLQLWVVDNTYVQENADLPEDLTIQVTESSGNRAEKHSRSSSGATSTERVRQGKSQESVASMITATAKESAIDVTALKGRRFLGFRFQHTAIIHHAGLRPGASVTVPEREGELLVAVYPTDRVAGAKQESFIDAVARQVNQASRDIGTDVVDAAVQGMIDELLVDRPYFIVCSRDQAERWKAAQFADKAAADVLNAEAVCRHVERTMSWATGRSETAN